ncbi:Zinc finger protein 45 [Araneus ventricosus]|uniref:Zinc finger protein 45 n=1 Tax=Araneus ventricosus TaxID=182803 RepID=A0A4Y2MID8_ARAVE|nr:Zinc finger protein 45 [Araneus ventricosus]
MDEVMNQTYIPKRSSPHDGCSVESSESSNLTDGLASHTHERLTNCEASEEVDLKIKCFESDTYGKTLSDGKNLNGPLPIHKIEKPSIFNVYGENTHFLTHEKQKPYVCEICSKVFTRSSSLISHLLTHTKEKPYVCEICSKAFARNDTFKFHLFTHTNEKPYVCEICDKAFTQNGRKVQPEDVLAYALAHPRSSTKMISENCSLSKSRVWAILNESGAHPYRSTPVQGLLPRDAETQLCDENLEDHPTFLADIIWTDEACFSRNGMFNRQNIHNWSLENPRYAVEVRHQLRWSITVWCGIFNDKLIGPAFYEETLTGQRYMELLQDVITDFVENLPLQQLRNVWFQHDGAPPHKISNVKQYLMETFQNQVIGYGDFVEWPPRSADLTPWDFFLWGHMKGQVYATPPPTLQDI